MAESKLNPKQEAFCQEYIIDFNGTQAGIRAGYSPKTAGQQAERLLRNVEIQARLQELKNARAKRVERSADEVVLRLWEIADLKVVKDIGVLKNNTFTLKDGEEWGEGRQRVVRTVKTVTTTRTDKDGGVTETTETTIKAPEALPALAELMKHYGNNADMTDLPPLLTIRLNGKAKVELDEPPSDRIEDDDNED